MTDDFDNDDILSDTSNLSDEEIAQRKERLLKEFEEYERAYIEKKYPNQSQQQISIQDLFVDKSIDENLIKSEIQSNDFVEYIIKQIKKTVKCEDILIRQILYTGLSSYIGFDPINLGIIAPTSEGKTYPVEECIKLFPKQDVEKVGSMSAKVTCKKKRDISR